MSACKKVSYKTEAGAIIAAKKQLEKKGVLRAYRCFNCMMWHLTHMDAKTFLKNNKHITR